MTEALKVANSRGVDRELFAAFRRNALAAEEGACTWL
jgi:phosphogluconate dehydratase